MKKKLLIISIIVVIVLLAGVLVFANRNNLSNTKTKNKYLGTWNYQYNEYDIDENWKKFKKSNSSYVNNPTNSKIVMRYLPNSSVTFNDNNEVEYIYGGKTYECNISVDNCILKSESKVIYKGTLVDENTIIFNSRVNGDKTVDISEEVKIEILEDNKIQLDGKTIHDIFIK